MSRKYACKVDDNQPQIVQAFRSLGYSVSPTHAAGQGFPDLVVGKNGSNYLVEVKDGSKQPSSQKLTKAQVKWHDEWNGQVVVVNSLEAVYEFNKEVERERKGN